MFGQEVYLRENPSVSISNEYLSESKIYLNEYPILFQFNFGYQSNYADYFDISIFSITTDEEYRASYKINKHLVDCASKEHDFIKYYDMISPLITKSKYYCMDFDREDYFQNKMGTQNSTYIVLSISYCDYTNENRNCKATPKYKNSNSIISVAFVDHYTDSFDYDKPVKEYVNILSYLFSYGVLKTLRFVFEKDVFISDNGWLLNSVKNQEDVVFNSLEIDTNLSLGSYTNKLMDLVIHSNNVRKKTSRTYLKVQELFAKIGGIVNALYIILYIVSCHYIRFKYIIWVKENSIDFINDPTNKNSSKNIINNNKSNNIIRHLNSNNKLILSPDKKNDNSVAQNLSNINNLIQNRDYIDINNSSIKINESNFQVKNNNDEAILSVNKHTSNNYFSNLNENRVSNKFISNEMTKSNKQDQMKKMHSKNDVVKLSSNINNKEKNFCPTITNNVVTKTKLEINCDSFKIKDKEIVYNDISNVNCYSNNNVLNIVSKNSPNKDCKVVINSTERKIRDRINTINEDLMLLINMRDDNYLKNIETVFKSYYKYLLYCISCCCCSKKKINSLFKAEINKVYAFLSITNFNYYLINQYNRKFKFASDNQ